MQNALFSETDRAQDVVCIGTALIDHLSFADFDTVHALGLPEGSMTLIDATTAVSVGRSLGGGKAISGGTVANTAVGIASLGGRPVFVGAVANDELGERYRDDLIESGVRPALQWFDPRTDLGGTGACYVIVTPDAERTMATTLGVSGLLEPEMIDETLISAASLVYFDGYLLDFPSSDDIVDKLVGLAGEEQTRIALGLADRFVVDRHYERLVKLLDVVDVVFANESEAIALSGGLDADQAIEALGRRVALAVVTRGPQGAVLLGPDGTVEIPAIPVAEVIDLTGAGDLFASGVCFGLTHGLDLAACGQIGALCASEIIGHLGARPAVELAVLGADAGLLAR